MTKGEMVERLAKALNNEDARVGFPPWEILTQAELEHYRKRAAIVLAELKAMGLAVVPREPTEEMIEAMPHMSDVGYEIWRNALAASPYD